MLFGVAGGLGEYFDVDPTLVRVAFVVLAFAGFGVLAYIVLAIVVPGKPSEEAATEDGESGEVEQSAKGGNRTGVGVILLLLGGFFLLTNLDLLDWFRWDLVWPVVIIAIGLLLIVGRLREA